MPLTKFSPPPFPRATFGCDDAGPNICVICEYDALPEIGHACGHNLIAECGVAAGIGIKAALETNGNEYGKVCNKTVCLWVYFRLLPISVFYNCFCLD